MTQYTVRVWLPGNKLISQGRGPDLAQLVRVMNAEIDDAQRWYGAPVERWEIVGRAGAGA